MDYEPPRWMIHFCPFDKDCRIGGKAFPAPWRLAFRVPGWYISIALRPRDRFAQIDREAWLRDKTVIQRRSQWTSVEMGRISFNADP